MLHCLIAGGTGIKKSRRACHFSAAHPATPDQKSGQPQLVPYVHHKWHTDTFYDIGLVKAQEMVHFGDVRAECIARVVGHIKRSCTKDHQKLHRTLRQSKQISVHRETACVTKFRNRTGLISSGVVSTSFWNLQPKMSQQRNHVSTKKQVRR